ncbi:hypothetical protein L249_5158 [Ophiocordyceps polyrhachis-furcata BCC 54312]|uniref:Protein kinase domain-containing protein n=1 Tax=Ophiocordyceps polyrhachis-furcata BCC 54312 TaxID=1330021 RepID=A0A367L8H0_9HYPO|nr:hypothetical protein L249_5158 [Ophiocordyceps polyrhachis-furcata BCC 54312]
MDFSSSLTFRTRHEPVQNDIPAVIDQSFQAHDRYSRCPNFAAFLAICFSNEDERLGLHPVLTNAAPDLDDVSLRGGSFDVRKVKSSSFPLRLADDLLRGRDFVIVKHPRPSSHDIDRPEVFSEIAMELQVLRHPPIRSHANVIDLVAVMYHDAGDAEKPVILPALVLEFAAFGSLKTFQEQGHGHSFEDKIDIALDTARGIEALHACGIVHGDVKASNMLVCEHPTRKFIVKVSDFGFSLVTSDSQLLGHTEVYCPPESYRGQLDPEQAKKLDVYCYGLLLHSILKEGTAYYPQGPDAPVGTSDDFRKMKVSGLMPATLVLNVLLTGPGREPYPLLLLCKILLYSLQPEPKQRIHDMSTIVFYLSLLESRSGDGAHKADKSPSAKVSAVLDTVTRAREGHNSGEASLVKSLITVIRAMMDTLEGQVLSVGSDQTHQFLAVIAKFTQMLLDNFIDTAEKLQVPMFEVICQQLRSRAQEQVSQIWQLSPRGPGQSQPTLSLARLCQQLLDCIGLIPEIGPSTVSLDGLKQSPSSSQLSLRHGYDLIPDFSILHGILQKMPWSVQKAAIQSLSQLHDTTADTVAKRRAAFSLASVYANGVGVEYDVKESSRLVLEAALLGEEKAQTIYINCFSPDETSLADETWRAWLEQSAEAGNAVALSRLRSLDPDAASAVSKSLRQKEFIAASEGTVEEARILPATLTDDTPGHQLKTILLSAIILDDEQVIRQCLKLDSSLLLTRFNKGEHALLIACRLGSIRAAEALVSPLNANLGDAQGARPLHWSSRFSGEQHQTMARLLVDHGADVNAIGPALYRSDHEQRVQTGRARWTPLHWAVAFDNPSAILELTNLGCDPTLRAEPDRGTWDLNPLELASSLCNSAALSALLTTEAVRSGVDKSRPMVQDMPVLITPLFYVVSSRSRWDRIRQHGMQFEQKAFETLSLLIRNGASTDEVLQSRGAKMPAVFATAYHSCCADVMASGLKLGFGNEIESACGTLSSGGSAIFLAITHRDRCMFKALIEAGASLCSRDKDGMTPLQRAAKENDDTFFSRVILDAGISVDPEAGSSLPSAFQIAVYCRNNKVAKLLFDAGADRDRLSGQYHRTILGDMLLKHTWNSLDRVKFLLDLPDRPQGGDGFIAGSIDSDPVSVLHLATLYTSEASTQRPEIATILVTQLLRKYNQKKHVNSTSGPFSMTPLGMAVENGDYGVVRKLLEADADANKTDKFGRTPLDLLYRRYCFPENLPTFDEVDHHDKLAVGRALRAINENTSEVMSLLKSYGAEAGTFRFPGWHEADASYRGVDWVVARLEEKTAKTGTEAELSSDAATSDARDSKKSDVG